ncbi:phosphoribosylformylglycinamidine synthase subunit PurS [Methanobacterium ferruginis]|jgi:phosphoribosylformylglycinamidine synthase|uniref:phosphoribosylformylglycinamidine synthase subunit PurS n=1 Tax=Methanobacterium ferruginis TaxID=710191 RepID=UPI002573CA53|nr:phosphoribosylformylglycinamidine synthase subunit PurS [Methanobacterium ferruginis]BDZ68185.1 phosphoribosylformylglycinamidine synthase [Methanobacterium ferruginis]
MKYHAQVEISLKKGMLNPEASTIQRALALLNYQVENTATMEIIKFTLEAEDSDVAHDEVVEMCERLLCNPVIHDYQIQINPVGD